MSPAMARGSEEYVLSFDFGNTSVKSALVDKVTLEVAHSFSSKISEPSCEAWVHCVMDHLIVYETSHADTWANVTDVAVSGMMQCLIVAPDMDPKNAIMVIHSDNQSQEEAKICEEVIGKEVLQKEVLFWKGPYSLLPKMMRMVKQGVKDVSFVGLGVADYIYWYLSQNLHAQVYTDATTATTTGLVRATATGDAVYHQAVVVPPEDQLGLDSEEQEVLRKILTNLPFILQSPSPSEWHPTPFQYGGREVGFVRNDVRVWHCGGDLATTTAGALFGHSPKEMIPYAYIGTSGWISLPIPRGVKAPDDLWMLPLYRKDGALAVGGSQMTAGLCFESACRMLGIENLNMFNTLAWPNGFDDPSLKILYLPYLRGERCPFLDPNASGVFLGIDPSTDRSTLCKAVIEGVALSYRHILDTFAELNPVMDNRLYVVGGGANSKAWCQTMAHVCNREIIVRPHPEMSSVVGAVALMSNDHSSGGDKNVRGEVYQPKPEIARIYDDYYNRIYRNAHSTLAPMYSDMAKFKDSRA
eukprot:Clim_evm4s96 gene=Clim_evmTU4s96